MINGVPKVDIAHRKLIVGLAWEHGNMSDKLFFESDTDLQNPTSSISLEQLHSMKLPKIPNHLSSRLRVNWMGKTGLPAASAVDAIVDECCQPLAVITLLMKKSKKTGEFRYAHEEEIPHHDLFREIENFIDLAEEEIREEKWIGT